MDTSLPQLFSWLLLSHVGSQSQQLLVGWVVSRMRPCPLVVTLSWYLLLLWVQVCCVSASIGSFRSWWARRAAMACTAVVKTLTQKTPAQQQEQQ